MDVQGLTDLVARLRAEKEPSPAPPPHFFTPEQYEAVVDELLGRLRARN